MRFVQNKCGVDVFYELQLFICLWLYGHNYIQYDVNTHYITWYQTNIFLSASFCEIQFYIERLIFKVTLKTDQMYSTQAIAKLEKNGKYEKITIGRGWTSEDDLDIDMKVTYMSPITELTWVSTQG